MKKIYTLLFLVLVFSFSGATAQTFSIPENFGELPKEEKVVVLKKIIAQVSVRIQELISIQKIDKVNEKYITELGVYRTKFFEKGYLIEKDDVRYMKVSEIISQTVINTDIYNNEELVANIYVDKENETFDIEVYNERVVDNLYYENLVEISKNLF